MELSGYVLFFNHFVHDLLTYFFRMNSNSQGLHFTMPAKCTTRSGLARKDLGNVCQTYFLYSHLIEVFREVRRQFLSSQVTSSKKQLFKNPLKTNNYSTYFHIEN